MRSPVIAGALLFATAGAALAATPEAGTLSADNPSLSYSSGPFAGANPSLQQDPLNPQCLLPVNQCDDFALLLDAPADYVSRHPRDLISVISQWPFNQAAYYLYLLDSSGAVIASSITDADPNGLSAPAAPGSYTVRIVPSVAAGDLLVTTVSLISDQTAPAAGKPPGFTAYAPEGLGDNTGGEMNIGFNPATGRVMTLAYTQTLRTTFAADGSATWEDVSEPNTQINTNDPILFTDPQTGRTFVSQLQAGTPGNSIFYYTDNDGDSWTLSPLTTDGGIDHQTVGGGPYSAGAGAGPSGSYPNAVYYCSQSIVVAFCIRSDDGGATFGVPVITKTVADCDGFLGGIHGHVKVAPDGTVYIPDRNCGGVQAVIVSENSGVSFEMRRLPATATAGPNDSSLGIASDGTGYLCYLSADGHAHVAVTHDKGLTWSNDRDVSYAAGVVHAVFPVAVAGDPDRAACGFLGTSTAQGNYQATSFEGIWFPYVATTYDGGNSWHTVNATPGDPVQGTGGICLGGTTCIENRNLLDFNDMTLDDKGRVLFGYDDGCTGDCLLPPHTPNQVCIPTGGINDICLNSVAKTSIIRQSDGRTLFAAFDSPAAPPPVTPPPAPVVTSPGDQAPGSGFLLGGLGMYLLLPLLGIALVRR
ncbi:MAG: sialidase family protein [Pseudomonadota bacterium]